MPGSRPPIVIIGAGMAAYSLAREFRKLDKTTPLMLVSGDAGGSYAKPMLSNAFALGKQAPQLVAASGAQMAATLNAQVLNHTRVAGIDRDARRIATDQGSFGYSKLVLALGAEPIRLPLDGDGAGEVVSVNHLALLPPPVGTRGEWRSEAIGQRTSPALSTRRARCAASA
jgi:rubredoxin-NAD+ reductase